ncbi:MAG TPA: DedA family protein [Desulfonatronum sp.]|nr:DedA family protein [Desulfonatronum sp.]
MKNHIFAKSALLLLLGLGVWFSLAMDWVPMLARAEELSHSWWLVIILMAAQAAFFALAMPGSIMFVIIGLLYDPLPATAMITVGGVLGSVLGYVLSKKMGHAWTSRLRDNRLFQVFRANTSLLMLCAIRIFPGFPHSIINYGSGLLHVPLARFTTSAIVGYMVKGMLYATALHNVVEIEDGHGLSSMDALWPLAVLAVLLVAGFVFQKWLMRKKARDRA